MLAQGSEILDEPLLRDVLSLQHFREVLSHGRG
jgi:hypothetical protein